MIILTGSQGFIGKNFLNKIEEPVVEVEKENAFRFLSGFDRWNEVSLILHQGAISSTTERNINTLHHNNVAFTLMLFDYAIKYQIPVKFASSASVYGNTNGQINPLNYYCYLPNTSVIEVLRYRELIAPSTILPLLECNNLLFFLYL